MRQARGAWGSLGWWDNQPAAFRRGFTMVELVAAIVVMLFVLLPWATVSSLVSVEQVRMDRLEQGLVDVATAMDEVTTTYTHPDRWNDEPMSWTTEGAHNWHIFCDPVVDSDCRPANCLDAACYNKLPKMIYRAWVENFGGADSFVKQVRVDVCMDFYDPAIPGGFDGDCTETVRTGGAEAQNELLVRVNKLIARRCPDSGGNGCPP